MRRSAFFLVVAAACAADHDPAQTLARLRAIVLDQAERLPNYACVQTIDRTFYRPTGMKPGHPGPCDEIAALKKARKEHLAAISADRFRVDVRIGLEEEMYSWVGAGHFSDNSINQLLGSGATTTGDLGPLLTNVVEDAPDFRYTGEQTAAGRPAYAYAFNVPASRSHHLFETMGRDPMAVAYRGTILADAETGTPLKLNILVDDPPPETNSCQFRAALNYSAVAIGASSLLLPEKATQRLVAPGGSETEYDVAFSSCHEYTAESRIRYGASAAVGHNGGPASGEPAPLPSLEAPSGLPVAIVLDADIDSKGAAAGDRFRGRLAKPLEDGAASYAPKGATVHGRVTMVLHAMNPDRVTIRLAVEAVELRGSDFAFHVAGALSQYLAANAPRPAGALQTRGAPIGDLPAVSKGYSEARCPGKRCVLHAGSLTNWITVRP
ncbi:MAG TPA: hypothetical protein VMU19_09845 [Bryobacteraceae bacterium]|nr:hypothetical protein [Bryobacteraceae bacterium]